MTTPYDSLAVYKLNQYVWKLIKHVHGWNESDYGNRTPIIPGRAETDIAQYEKPYIIYGYGLEEDGITTTQQVAYTIVSKSGTEIDKLLQLISDALKRGAQSAKDVNKVAPYGFKTITVSGYTSPESDNVQQGDWQEGIILVRMTYAVDTPKIAGFISEEI